jgi:hypothetical protein
LPQHKNFFNSKSHSKSNNSTSTQYTDNKDDNYDYVLTTNHWLDLANLVSINKHIIKDFEDDWILDTGATQHMFYIKDYFWKYHDMELDPIYFADDTTHTPQGKGSVQFFLPGIGKVLIYNVWYVPSFKRIYCPWSSLDKEVIKSLWKMD